MTIREFDEKTFIRYSRHLIMPEVGIEGQRKLSDSSVLVVGAGGLGSPALLYLAAAGVGKIGVVDYDNVERSNLQRQVIYTENDIGRKKAIVAREKILSLNPQVEVVAYEMRLDSSNALSIIKDYDIVIDGTDNFPTRYLINDSCSILGRPFVYGSIYRFDGQVSFFDPRVGPCYRCLFSEPPPSDSVPTCAEGGVLGVLPGIVGSIQALEAVKYIIGKGELLIGRLLLVNTLNLDFTILKISKDQKCIACGKERSLKELVDYEAFCGISNDTGEILISPEELYAKLSTGQNVKLIDVRERYESELYSIEGAKRIPLSELIDNVSKLDSSEEIVVFCHTGIKGGRAARMLRQMGFRKVRNLAGGVLGWASFLSENKTKISKTLHV